MSEQFQQSIVATSPELFSIDTIDTSELNHQYMSSEANHMIANKTYHPMTIHLPFPPTIEPRDLIINKKSPQPNGKQVRAPNAFIIYRKAFVKAARDQGHILPMTAISSLASASWEQESTTVKEEYKKIAKDAHKLIKEMFPKKPNQRKRKEIWNLVSFQDKSLKNINLSENNSSEIISQQESTEMITPTLTSSTSSPILSDSEENFAFQQQFDNNIDDTQISNDNYLELMDQNLPTLPTFQEYYYNNDYLSKENGNNFLLTNWLNNYHTLEPEQLGELELLDTTTSLNDTNDLKDHSQSSLKMTLSEAMGMINSEGFGYGYGL
ncbi:hypothetical protein C1645_7009 [Glomus cerebriforme]|uniref:HMG box domain-containing protein n=1 Tax=Glomus cerebriforme TaxID=658196 RepID=A0A397T5G5_9GLOM|nr:hypothetical protein C1645_7009 [Glomus cerebriforme]